jgi:hypothetical protein
MRKYAVVGTSLCGLSIVNKYHFLLHLHAVTYLLLIIFRERDSGDFLVFSGITLAVILQSRGNTQRGKAFFFFFLC